MTNPEFNSTILNFKQEFDGAQPELSTAEKMESTYLFKSGIQDVFLNHIDKVKKLPGSVDFYPWDFSQLRLRTILDSGVQLDFDVKSFDSQIP
ncbi:MAG TPA: hypothetical protein VH144_00205 [Candidatus Saccharimonadales bacterium]|jgi:hypothetical protein|nr:hypothetical protein [Candidatus Saccharimonadales bacterium]